MYKVDNLIIDDRDIHSNESHILVNSDCINETNPTSFDCNEHWMYHDEDGKLRNDPMAKVACQGNNYLISYNISSISNFVTDVYIMIH